VGDLKDRRARKKAQTREQILRVAQQLFAARGFEAVTIADIAAGADVAVQTVFNHFATKEELFFADRAEWVDAAANAVRTRPEGMPPLSALRSHLTRTVRWYLDAMADQPMRSMILTLEASPALIAYERVLHAESVRRLSDALVEACPEGNSAATGTPPSVTLRASASLTSAVWLAAIHALIIEQRAELAQAVGDEEAAAAIERLADQVLGQFEATQSIVLCCPPVDAPAAQITGWPSVTRRAV
jgi:AcrR family transcriptional regulator